jgi:hypothetical protein
MNSIIQVIFVIPDFVRRWEKYLCRAVVCHFIGQWVIYRHRSVGFCIDHYMRFQVLTTVNIKMTGVWDVIGVYQCFRGTCCLCPQGRRANQAGRHGTWYMM